MGFPRSNPLPLALAARRDWSEAMAIVAGWKHPVVRVPVGVPLLVVRDAEAAHAVLVTDASSYEHPWIVRNIMRDALGEVLFTKEGTAWADDRRRVAPFFSHANLDRIGAEVATAIDDELDTWEAGVVDDVEEALTRLTMRVACRALLGVDPRTHPLGRAIDENFRDLLDWLAYRFSNPISPPAVIPTRRNRRLRRARAALADALAEVLEERRASQRSQPGDVLDLLLAAQERGEPVTDADIISEAIGFLFGGHETTASTLTWALYELATNQDVQAGVVNEARDVTIAGSSPHDQAQRLAFTGRVVDETLRLYPPGVGIARVATKTTLLLGKRVRRHTIILIAVLPMQRSPAWPSADSFDPYRSFPSSRQQPPEGAAGYLPFGWGPRRCLGARFAITEARLALAAICRRWTLEYQSAHPPQLAVVPSLRPRDPLSLRLTPRHADQR